MADLAKGGPGSEDDILFCLARHFDTANSRVALGRGDDCAVLKGGGPLCVSSDLFLEDSHFRTSYFTPQELGHKALAVNISDIAGFGARPAAFNLCLGLPDWVDMAWLDSFFEGMAALARREGIALCGGDLSTSQKLHISITIFGENLEGCGFLGRGGAMPGDAIFVVGFTGLARIGLKELEKKGRDAILEWPAACAAHLTPVPQTAAGLMLARAGGNARPPALMDVSDGILRDLPRLLGLSGELGSHSGSLGADLDLPEALLHPELMKYALRNGRDAAIEALIGGEDYALLGACAPDMISALHAAIPNFFAIGHVSQTGELRHRGVNLSGLRGFDHFEIRAESPHAAEQ